eukprot:6093614-Pyramimonas_sp.AAC.1
MSKYGRQSNPSSARVSPPSVSSGRQMNGRERNPPRLVCSSMPDPQLPRAYSVRYQAPAPTARVDGVHHTSRARSKC